MTALAAALPHRINDPADIPPEQVYEGMLHLLALPAGQTRDVMLGSVLTGLLLRGPRLDEVEPAIRAALSLDQPSREVLRQPAGVRLIGYTGSGKKAFKTFNISTSAALVAAAGGARIAKLGSRSASSVTGSRDFMHHVGAKCDMIPADEMADLAAELGFGFFAIENRIPEFDHRYGGRFQTVHALSLALPALLSPVECDAHVYGLAHPAVDTSAALLERFGLRDVTVLSSQLRGGYVDELIPGTAVRARTFIGGAQETDLVSQIAEATAASRFEPTTIAQYSGAARNVATAVRVLAGGHTGGACDAVVLNAGLLLAVSGVVVSFSDGLERARQVVETGAALDVLLAFIRATGGSDMEVWSLLSGEMPAPSHMKRHYRAVLATTW